MSEGHTVDNGPFYQKSSVLHIISFSHARVLEGVKPFKTVSGHVFQKSISLQGSGKLAFGDPFLDSGVEGLLRCKFGQSTPGPKTFVVHQVGRGGPRRARI